MMHSFRLGPGIERMQLQQGRMRCQPHCSSEGKRKSFSWVQPLQNRKAVKFDGGRKPTIEAPQLPQPSKPTIDAPQQLQPSKERSPTQPLPVRKEVDMRNHQVAEALAGESRSLLEKEGKDWLAVGSRLRVRITDDRVPPFHEEFKTQGRWPEPCDISACYNHLWFAYERGRANPRATRDLGKVKGGVLEEDLQWRLGTDSREVLEWWIQAELGEVRPWDGTSIGDKPEEPRLRSFGEEVNYADRLYPGTTHVAVGFLDFGSLAASCLRWERDGGGAASVEAPLLWVGYEPSGYSVAKAEVVAQMMRGGAQGDHVLQVWYSAAWSKAALASFRAALAQVLDSRGSLLSGQALAYLEHWQAVEVSPADSRKLWLDSIKMPCFPEIANLKVKEDRLAMCSYLVSGQLLEADVGSVVMFALPKGAGERAFDEAFLHVIGDDELLDARKQGAPDVIAAGVEVLRARIKALTQHLSAGSVAIEVKQQAVQPESSALHEEIRRLRPYTIAWNSTCDDCSPSSFHAMARACSAPSNTVHYLRSVQWPRYVKGASCIDFLAPSMACDNAAAALYQYVQLGERLIATTYLATGWKDLLLNPLCANFREVFDTFVISEHVQGWLMSFLLEAGGMDLSRQAAMMRAPVFSIFAQAHTTVYFAFSYDPEISAEQRFDALPSWPDQIRYTDFRDRSAA